MAGFPCPYCSMIMSLDRSTVSTQHPCFESSSGVQLVPGRMTTMESTVAVTFYKCPNCNSYTVKVKGEGNKVSDIDMMVRPRSNAQHYPDYVPLQIRKDYEEACAILALSPKSSATLARRCLQGMIRDFWKIKKSNLNEEISALQDKIHSDLWQALNDLRQLGNIGAHMEKDVNLIIDIEYEEAEKLIQFIELLIKEWYISDAERNKLLGDIFKINSEKQAQRKGEG